MNLSGFYCVILVGAVVIKNIISPIICMRCKSMHNGIVERNHDNVTSGR